MYGVLCVRHTVYSVHYTPYHIHCTLYSVQCTYLIYTGHSCIVSTFMTCDTSVYIALYYYLYDYKVIYKY